MSGSPFAGWDSSDASTYLPLDSMVVKIEPGLELDGAEPLENEEKLKQNQGKHTNNDTSCPTLAPMYYQICQNGPFVDMQSLQTHSNHAHSTTSSPNTTREVSMEEEKYSAIDENIATSFNDVDTPSPCQFTCQQCQATFQTLVQFINHMRIKHLAPTQTTGVLPKHFHCSICTKEFASVEKKTEHMMQHFISTTSIYSCHCASTFVTPHQLQQHFIASHTEMLYRCGVCLQLFTDNIAYQRHTTQHVHESISYNCVSCKVSFKSMDLLGAHVRLTHAKPGGPQPVYSSSECQSQCEQIDTDFSKSLMAANYEDLGVSFKHPPKKQKLLHKTQRRLYMKSRLQRTLCEGRNGFKCQICDVVFSSQQFLHNHHSKVHEVSLLKQKSGTVEKPSPLFM